MGDFATKVTKIRDGHTAFTSLRGLREARERGLMTTQSIISEKLTFFMLFCIIREIFVFC